MKKLLIGIRIGAYICVVISIFIFDVVNTNARLPDSDGLIAENGDIITVTKFNQFLPSTAVFPFYSTSCPAGRKPANGNSGTPDLRGRFIRGLNSFEGGTNVTTSANGDPDCASRIGGCVIGSFQSDNFKSHNHPLIYQRNFIGENLGHTTGRAVNNRAEMGYGAPRYREDGEDMPYRGGNETRGKNIALIFCMKN